MADLCFYSVSAVEHFPFFFFFEEDYCKMILNSFHISACWPKWNWWTTCETPRGLNLGIKTKEFWRNRRSKAENFLSTKYVRIYISIYLSIYWYDVSEFTFIPVMVYWIMWWFNGPVITFSVSVYINWSWVWFIQDFSARLDFLEKRCFTWRRTTNQQRAGGTAHALEKLFSAVPLHNPA